MKSKKKSLAYLLVFAMVFGMFLSTDASAAKKISLSKKKITITKGKSATIKVKNTKKKATWKILSGKKVISLKKKGKTAAVITGKKKGTATVQAKVGKNKFACKVTVTNAAAKAVTPSASPTTAPSTAPSTAPTQSETPTQSATPTPVYEGQAGALKEIIDALVEAGATVNEDPWYREQYVWQDGDLVAIYWTDQNISGELDLSAFPELTTFFCQYNDITSLNLSENRNLVSLNCNDTLITELDLSNNTKLTEFVCNNAGMAANGYAPFEQELAALKELISTLRAAGATVPEDTTETVVYQWKDGHLIRLNWVSTNISPELDLSPFPELVALSLQNNPISSLDLSENKKLTKLNCDNTDITELDLSNNLLLTAFACNNTITVPNGYAPYEQDKAALNAIISAQKALGATISEDIHNDSEYKWWDGRLIFILWDGGGSGKGLKGELDTSSLTELLTLKVSCNSLTSIDITGNANLEEFECYSNRELGSVDVSKNTKLRILNCSACGLTELDLSNNPELYSLNIFQNKLTTLDLSNNTKLGSLTVRENQLTELDVSMLTGLTNLDCTDNLLTALGLSNNLELINLHCRNNGITSLDLTNNKKITANAFECDDSVVVTNPPSQGE